MKRSILLSLMAIGAAIALVVGGASFAAFTDTDNDSGTVTAGDVEIDVLGSGTLEFDSGDAGCDLALAPGDTCGPDTVTITNNGTLSVTLSDPVIGLVVAGGEGACSSVDGTDFDVTISAQSYVADVDVVAPAGTETFDVAVELLAGAAEGCQGATATVTVTVTATSD